jgi:hypothetical protein
VAFDRTFAVSSCLPFSFHARHAIENLANDFAAPGVRRRLPASEHPLATAVAALRAVEINGGGL